MPDALTLTQIGYKKEKSHTVIAFRFSGNGGDLSALETAIRESEEKNKYWQMPIHAKVNMLFASQDLDVQMACPATTHPSAVLDKMISFLSVRKSAVPVSLSDMVSVRASPLEHAMFHDHYSPSVEVIADAKLNPAVRKDLAVVCCRRIAQHSAYGQWKVEDVTGATTTEGFTLTAPSALPKHAADMESQTAKDGIAALLLLGQGRGRA